MVASPGSPSVRTGSRLLAVLAVLSAGAAAGYLLVPHPLADAFFAMWVLGSVAASVVVGFAAWTGRTALAWAAALSLTGIAVLGAWSLGPFVAPAAALSLGAAALSQVAGPAADRRERTVSEPPPASELALKTLAGVGSAVVGGFLVYEGSLRRELFGACAAETPACVVARTHWDAVGTTVVGLTAVAFGGWLVWRQVAARSLASGADAT